jgi:hypothetical protein
MSNEWRRKRAGLSGSDMVAGMTREPRAAINKIEQEIGLLRDLIAEREQMLVEAIGGGARKACGSKSACADSRRIQRRNQSAVSFQGGT